MRGQHSEGAWWVQRRLRGEGSEAPLVDTAKARGAGSEVRDGMGPDPARRGVTLAALGVHAVAQGRLPT